MNHDDRRRSSLRMGKVDSLRQAAAVVGVVAFLVVGLSLGTVGVVMTSVGCASDPGRAALQTLQALKASADSYMRIVGSQYALGRHYDINSKMWTVVDPAAVVISDDLKAKSIDAYDKFAASSKAAAFALGAVTTPAQGDAIVAEVQTALGQLLALLRAFGVKGI